MALFRDARDAYLRVLGVIYAVAFASWGLQVRGLVGDRGVLPAADVYAKVGAKMGALWYWHVPSLVWLSPHDGWLVALCAIGTVAGLFMAAGVWGRGPRVVAWLLYLSAVNGGDVFLGYQWEALLLEAGFLAIFLPEESPWMGWLHRWLLFRLLFSSGLVKLLSGDPTWRSLTALRYHFETQPLPTWVAWYAHRLPGFVLSTMTLLMFALELGIPFLFFVPNERARRIGFGGVILLQVAILLTGNYTYFNWLTIALALFLLERPAKLSRPAPGVVALGALGLLELIALVGLLPRPVAAVLDPFERARITASYGLFAVMTTERDELVLEGSADGKVWKAYELPYQPQDPRRAPGFVAPYQPRLDWQAWFAALGTFPEQRWLHGTMKRLLEGEPAVLALFRTNPFPDKPPQWLRVRRWRYRFSDGDARRATGAWWVREERGEYGPPAVSLADFD